MRVTRTPEGPEELGQVDRRRLALDARVGGEDDLFDLVGLEPRQQLPHLQIVGADAVQRRERAQQHVVAPAELARPLQRQQVVRLLDDAERPGIALGSRQMRQGSSSVTLKQTVQWTMRALSWTSDSASVATSAAGRLRRKKVSRWAVLGPMPGSR